MTDDTANNTTTETTEKQLTVERTFDAPPGRVYTAFTDPDEFAAWYGPGPMDVTVEEFDVRPEGSYAISMESDNHTYRVEGQFTDVVENERLVRTARSPSGGDTVVSVTFEAVEDGTKVVLTQAEFEPGEGVERAAQAWAGSFETLAGRL